MMRVFLILCLAIISAGGVRAEVRGEPDARAAAVRLLEAAGGAEAWRSRTFYAEERAFLRSGEVADLRIWRDFDGEARRLENRTPTRTIVEWLSPAGGWEARDGVLSPMSPSTLAAELQGLRQEPYAIYHRLALGDPKLRVELRDGPALYVFDADERLLCWFPLDRTGAPIGWGNVYDGAINQHYYGPLVDVGDANLPRWGVSGTGAFRFEYIAARLTDEAVTAPPQPAATNP